MVILSLVKTPQPFADFWGSVAQIDWRSGFPFPRTESSYGFSDGYAERGEAFQNGHTDLELGYLTVEVPRSQTLDEQFDTVHFRFDAAPAVIAVTLPPGFNPV